MKTFLLALILLTSHLGFVQTYLEFNKLDLHTQQQQMDYVNRELLKQESWNARKVELICLKSTLFNHQGDYAESKALLNSIPKNEIVKDKGNYHLALAKLSKYEKDFEASYDNFKLAQKTFRSEKKYCLLADAYIEEAEYHRKYLQFELAVTCIESAESLIAKHTCDPWIKVKMLNRYAAIANEYPKAPRKTIELSKEAISLAKQEKMFYYLAVSYSEIAYSYFKIKKVDSAKYYSQKSEIEFRKLGLSYDAIHAKYGRACYAADVDETILLLKEIIEEVVSKKIKHPLVYVYNRLVHCYKLKNNYKEALYYFELENELWRKGIKENQDLELAKIADDFKSIRLISENKYIKTENKLKEERITAKEAQVYVTLFITMLLVLFSIALFVNAKKRKKLNEELLKRNKQKDILIQEIHHRVKNNLQFISSLVNLQMSYSKDQTIRMALLDTSRRIKSMALVHEFLYNVDSNEIVDLKIYLHELIGLINDMVDSEKLNIHFQQEIDSIEMNASSCVSIGMIASEFITNSIKHAFIKQDNPIIKLKLFNNGKGKYIFELSDNGVGFQFQEKEKENQLGLSLIDIFVTQLKGEYHFRSENGFNLHIEFDSNLVDKNKKNGL